MTLFQCGSSVAYFDLKDNSNEVIMVILSSKKGIICCSYFYYNFYWLDKRVDAGHVKYKKTLLLKDLWILTHNLLFSV